MVRNNNLILIKNQKPVERSPDGFNKPFEEVCELKDYEVKKSPLSPTARNKVVNKSGSNFQSEKGSYGPCLSGSISNCRCSKEELERQKALIELQREKEKLEAERKQ